MKYFLLISIILLSSCSTFIPNKLELDGVVKDGNFLYQYDRACWVATDSLLAIKPNNIVLGSFFAKETDGTWEVVFGRLSKDSTSYMIAYKVKLDSSMKAEVKEMLPLERDTSFYYKAAYGFHKSMNYITVPMNARRYNYFVQPRQDSILRFYFLPANLENDIYLLGDDEFIDYRYDDLKKLDQRRMHKSLLTFDFGKEEIKITYSTAVLTKIPTPSDVFFVLTKEPRVQHMVVTDEYTYFIHPNSKILYLTNSQMKTYSNKNK